MAHLEHFPIAISEEDGVFTITQQFGSTADDLVTIKITSDQAKQIAKFLNSSKVEFDADAPGLDAGFAEFWQAYPRKDGKARAFDLWKRQHLHRVAERVMLHLNSVKHTDQWAKDGGRFVPHASTYLSQRRYMDEVEQEDSRQFL